MLDVRAMSLHNAGASRGFTQCAARRGLSPLEGKHAVIHPLDKAVQTSCTRHMHHITRGEHPTGDEQWFLISSLAMMSFVMLYNASPLCCKCLPTPVSS